MLDGKTLRCGWVRYVLKRHQDFDIVPRHPQSKLATIVGLSSKQTNRWRISQTWPIFGRLWSFHQLKKTPCQNKGRLKPRFFGGLLKNRSFHRSFPSQLNELYIVDSKVLGWSNKVYYHRVEFEEWHPITSPLSAWRRDQTFLQMFFFHKSAERVGWDISVEMFEQTLQQMSVHSWGRWFAFRRCALFFWRFKQRITTCKNPIIKEGFRRICFIIPNHSPKKWKFLSKYRT